MGIAVLVLTFFLALLSLIYELLIAQTMSLLVANTVVCYGLTMGVFIGGMGLGALCTGWFKRGDRPLATLAWIEVLLALIGGGAVLLLYLAHTGVLLFSTMIPTVIFFLLAFVCALAVGIMTGAELPILMDLSSHKKLPQTVSQILGADYFGALVAGVLFPVFLLPYFSVLQIGFWAGALSALVAFLLLWVEQDARGQKQAFLSAGVVILLGSGFFWAPQLDTFFAKKYYFASFTDGGLANFLPSPEGGLVKRERSPYQQIDIVTFPDAKEATLQELLGAYQRPPARADQGLLGWALFLNGDFQFAADAENVYHEAFAHMPLSATGVVPRRVLILGAGDGLLAREILKYPSVQEVTLVEIDEKMIRMFRDDPAVKALSAGALEDPRLKIVIADAYDFVRRDDGRYDTIYLDFPAPVDYDLAKLYSREFYTFLRARLAPEGVVAMDAPGVFPADEAMPLARSSSWPSYVETLKAAGFGTVVPYFSRLEDDNPAALAVMKKMYAGVEGVQRTDIDQTTGETKVVEITGEDEVQREFLRNHVHELTAGFLFAMIPPNVSLPHPSLPSVPLEILDQRRLELGLQAGRSFAEKGNRFNSIFRPLVLRSGAWWKIRTPY